MEVELSVENTKQNSHFDFTYFHFIFVFLCSSVCISGLFVDIGNNYSVLAHPNICFVYDYVGSKDEEKSQGDFVGGFVLLEMP